MSYTVYSRYMQNYIIWSYLVLRDLDIWGETLCNSSYEHVDLVMWSFEGKKHSIPCIHGSLLDSMNSRDLRIVFQEMHLLHQHLMQGFILLSFSFQPPFMCFNWRIIPMAYRCPCFDFVSTSESLSLVLVCTSHLQTTVCCACSPTGETRRHAKSRHFEVLRWHNYQDASCMMFGTGQTGFPLANDTFGWIFQVYTNFSSNISWHNRHHNHRDHYII